jgi:rubrerythrin
VATKQTMIGPGIIPLPLRAEGDAEATREFSAAYEAGFKTGFTMGRQAGLKAGEPGSPLPAVKKNTRVLARRRAASRRYLLGLPCRSCGAYYGSDEKRCPICKKPAVSGEQLSKATASASC